LCQSSNVRLLHTSSGKLGSREFYLCGECDLVHVPMRFHLPPDAEKARYLLHNNDTDDPEYRNFLSRLWDVLRPELVSTAQGLDFGSGPGPALVQMAIEDGYDISAYDPYFQPDTSVLETKYDFITCSETAEHFALPAAEFKLLYSMLEPGGLLGIMTSMPSDWSRFPDWYYNRDPTHVAFYSQRTMSWIADLYNMDISFPVPNVAIFRKLPSV
jgi:hypothetical protein